MKTISIQTGTNLSFQHSEALVGTARDHAGFGPGQLRNRLPQWLPAPSPRALPATKPRAAKAVPSAPSLWIPLPPEPIAEKLIMVLLVLTTMVAIGFGFASMLDLVQDWAGFNSFVSQLIQ